MEDNTLDIESLSNRLNELRIILQNMYIRELEIEAAVQKLAKLVEECHDTNQTMLALEDE